eukprot:2748343-Pyramimonas_sp.AAC.2
MLFAFLGPVLEQPQGVGQKLPYCAILRCSLLNNSRAIAGYLDILEPSGSHLGPTWMLSLLAAPYGAILRATLSPLEPSWLGQLGCSSPSQPFRPSRGRGTWGDRNARRPRGMGLILEVVAMF